MATNTQNALAVLNALYNFRKGTPATSNVTMPQALRDRFLAAYTTRAPMIYPDGNPPTTDQIAAILLNDAMGPLMLMLDTVESAALAASNRAALNNAMAPVVIAP